MKQLYRLISVLFLISVFLPGISVAQDDTTKLNQSVEVMKAYRPTISNANKVNLMPVIADTTRFSPEFAYSIDSNPVTSGFKASPIQPADVNKASYHQLGSGYLKLGAGTNSTPYGEFFLNLPESRTAVFGLHLRHLSSQGKIKLREGDLVEAPYSHNNGAIFGRINVGNTVLSTDLSYDRDAVNYYGYPTAITNSSFNAITLYGLKQVYQNGDFKISLKNSEPSHGALQFDTGFRLGFFDSKTGQKENSGGVFGKFDYNLEQFHGLFDVSYDHISTDSIYIGNSYVVETKQEDWLRIAPSVRLDGDNWSLRGGINFIQVNDKTDGNTTKLYPDFEFNFRPVEGILTLYASFKGDLKNNSYGCIARENYWAEPRHNVRNTDYTYVVSGGLKGKISREISYNLGLKYSQVKDLYFYTMNSFDNLASNTIPAPVLYRNAFDVTYDNATITNFSAEFSYVSGNDLSVVLKGNYYSYNLENMNFAPQKPDFDLMASTSLKIIDRVTGFADLSVIGERKALVKYLGAYLPFSSANVPSPLQLKEFTIDPTVQVNLGASFEMTSNFKLFGRVDNLLNRQNEQWLGYASQGLRVLVGVTLSF